MHKPHRVRSRHRRYDPHRASLSEYEVRRALQDEVARRFGPFRQLTLRQFSPRTLQRKTTISLARTVRVATRSHSVQRSVLLIENHRALRFQHKVESVRVPTRGSGMSLADLLRILVCGWPCPPDRRWRATPGDSHRHAEPRFRCWRLEVRAEEVLWPAIAPCSTCPELIPTECRAFCAHGTRRMRWHTAPRSISVLLGEAITCDPSSLPWAGHHGRSLMDGPIDRRSGWPLPAAP